MGNELIVPGKRTVSKTSRTELEQYEQQAKDTLRSQWVLENLNYKLITDKATESGKVQGKVEYTINMDPSEHIYDLRSVDALIYDSTGEVIYRYPERKISAGIFSESNNVKKVILGFPLESVIKNQETLFDEIFQLLKW